MDNINDIISSLSAEDINMLKGVAASILGENNTSTEQPSVNQSPQSNPTNALSPAGLGLDSIDFEMIMKAKNIFEKMNKASSKNVDLINALKPHLSPQTQNKADQALKILKLFEVLPLIREMF